MGREAPKGKMKSQGMSRHMDPKFGVLNFGFVPGNTRRVPGRAWTGLVGTCSGPKICTPREVGLILRK